MATKWCMWKCKNTGAVIDNLGRIHYEYIKKLGIKDWYFWFQTSPVLPHEKTSFFFEEISPPILEATMEFSGWNYVTNGCNVILKSKEKGYESWHPGFIMAPHDFSKVIPLLNKGQVRGFWHFRKKGEAIHIIYEETAP